MASERETPSSAYLELLRSCCEEEIAAARLVRASRDEDYLGDREPAKSWIKAHGARTRLTHPHHILSILDHLDRITEAGEGMWAWMASSWGEGDGQPMKQDAIDAWNKAADG